MQQLEVPSDDSFQPHDLKSVDGVIRFMSDSVSPEDWNSHCEQVQAANGGKYPRFWFPAIMLTELRKKTVAGWDGTDEIK